MAEPVLSPGAAGAPGQVQITEGDLYLFDTPLFLRPVVAVPSAQAQRWADHYIAVLESTYAASWDPIFASPDDYNTLLADRASAGYPDYVSATAVTRKGRTKAHVVRRHDRQIHAAYDRYRDAITQLTTVGLEAFTARVRASESAYRRGEALPISATGAYLARFIECAVKHVWWLVSNPVLRTFLSPLDYMEGDWPPTFDFCVAGPKWDIARHGLNLYVQMACAFLTDDPLEGVYRRADDYLAGALAAPYAVPPESQIRVVQVETIPHLRTIIALAGT